MKRLSIVIIFIFCIYFLTRIQSPTPYNYFILLSKSILQGRIYLTDNPPWLNELVPSGDPHIWYVVYPPMPAIMAIPFVVFNIADKSQTFMSIVYGALNAGLFFILICRLYPDRRYTIPFATTVAFAFGTSHWFLATEGSSWYISHVIAVFFLLSSLLIIQLKQQHHNISVTSNPWRWLIAGIFLGCAYWSRLPTSVAALFFMLIPLMHISSLPHLHLKQALHTLFAAYKPYLLRVSLFCIGFALLVAINAVYNVARYGTVQDIGYWRIPGILNEPWFSEGFLSYTYIPRSFWFFLTKMPLPHDQFPFFKPSVEGLSWFFVSPFFILLPFIRWRRPIILAAFITGCAMLIPVLMHGGKGFTQFGYRYAMEATIMFMIAWSSVLTHARLKWLAFALIICAISINYWGVYFIRTLEIYGW